MHIIGHHIVRAKLQEKSERESLRQGYLFFGPQSVGKSLCALEFSARLAGEPDFVATVDKPFPFDVRVVKPEEETKRGVIKQKNIGAEEIRETLNFLAHFPTRGKYRIVIIEEAHKLSATAQNVLLKTLEEPQSTAVIILVTHEGGSLFDTLLSRVERVRFDFVPEREILKEIEHLFPTDKMTEKNTVAPFFFSLGRPGMIVRAKTDPLGFEEEREKLSSLFRLSTLSSQERLALAEKLSVDVPGAIWLLEWWLPGLHTQALKIEEVRKAARYFELLEETEATLRLLKTTQSNARLLFEKLFLSI